MPKLCSKLSLPLAALSIGYTVKPVLVTTCMQRPPLLKGCLVTSHSNLSIRRWGSYYVHNYTDHSLTAWDTPRVNNTFSWPRCGRLMQVSLYDRSVSCA